MRKGIIILVLILLFAGFTAAPARPAGEVVYVVPLTGPVEPGLERYLARSFKDAVDNGASAIILELNTPGGRVDSASNIRDMIYDLPIPVYGYVRYSAISAGAFLALSCQEFYMAPGSSIGAAELRTITGETAEEKETSYWERQMRGVAERQGKDPEVAAAMVRQEIAIEGLVSEGKLLTLTAKEAESIGFTGGIFPAYSDLLAHLGYTDAELVTVDMTPAERIARLITNPAVATVLITVGLAALVIEVLTAGFGVAGFISILAFGLFFGGHIFAGLAGREVIFLFLLGVILLLVEAVLPNFGIVGLSGLAAIVTSIVLSAANTGAGLRMLAIALFLTVLIVLLSFRFLKRTGLWSQLVLQFAETKEQGYVGPANVSHLVGQEGVTLTALRPAGMADIGGKRIDVVSEGGFVMQGATVTVTAVEGTRVVVRPQ
jgi:membrane-bound serine protease (ClpP class)